MLDQVVKLQHIFVYKGVSHTQGFQFDLGLLHGTGIEELGLKLYKKLFPNFWDILEDVVERVEPISHIMDPSCNFFSFDVSEGEGHLEYWGVIP